MLQQQGRNMGQYERHATDSSHAKCTTRYSVYEDLESDEKLLLEEPELL